MSGDLALAHLAHNGSLGDPDAPTLAARPHPSQGWNSVVLLKASSQAADFSRLAVLLRRPPTAVKLLCCTNPVGSLLSWLSLRCFGLFPALSGPCMCSTCHWRRHAMTRFMCKRNDSTPWSLHDSDSAPNKERGPHLRNRRGVPSIAVQAVEPCYMAAEP